MEKCASLSPREKEVLQGLAYRRRAKEIARDLKISENTVRGYANEARQKLGMTSVRDAAMAFLEFETSRSPPHIRGDRFQRVSEHLVLSASLERGPSTPLQTVHDQLSDDVSLEQGKIPFIPGHKQYDQLVKLHAWLAGLNLTRWIGVTVMLTLGVIAAFGFAAMTLLGVFEVLHQIGDQHR